MPTRRTADISCAQHVKGAEVAAEVGFHAPERDQEPRRHAVFLLHLGQQLLVFPEQFLALLDAPVRHIDLHVTPQRQHEFRLPAVQFQDARDRLHRAQRPVEDTVRDSGLGGIGAKPLEPFRKRFGGGGSGARPHQAGDGKDGEKTMGLDHCTSVALGFGKAALFLPVSQ
jgi:hypothetical protein